MSASVKRLAVLGGCGGIGRALIGEAVLRGLEPIVFDLASSIERHPPKVEHYAVDITDPANLNRIAGKAGRFDGFANLAGFMSDNQNITETSTETWHAVIDGNLTGAFNAAKAFVPHLGKDGSIVMVGSGLGSMARPGYGPYAAAKAAISALTRQLALELSPDIRVNCLAPSAVDTAFLRGGTGRSEENSPVRFDPQKYGEAVPLGRIAQPVDVVGPLLFLLSDDARYITGQTLHVNGGTHMT